MAVMPVKSKRTGRTGSWATVVTWRDDDGRRHQTKRHAATRAAARQLEYELMRNRGRDRARGTQISVARFMADWLRTQNGLRPRTVETYGYIFRPVEAQLGDVPLSKLTPLQLLNLYADLRTQWAGSSVALLHTVLKHALNDAVKWGIVSENPAGQIKLPRRERFEHFVLSREHLLAIFDAADQTGIGPLVRFTWLTGLRIGEVLALAPGDVDAEALTLHVRRTLAPNGVLSPLKSAASNRRIRLSPDAFSIIETAPGPDRIFEPHTVHSVQNLWRKTVKLAGTPRARFHDLRHAHATHLLAAGHPIAAVSKRLGHATIQTTVRVYAHVLPGQDDAIAASMDGLLANSSEGYSAIRSSSHDRRRTLLPASLPG